MSAARPQEAGMPGAAELGQSLAAAGEIARAEIAAAIGAPEGPVAEAMLYATAGGKGLRAFLVLESAALHGMRVAAARPAAAIECIHAYSLIHDDLPCMDDDDLRRGQPTVHRRWDEATAVLAGDALQALAFGLVARTDCPAPAALALTISLAEAAGLPGMVGGQALDIAAESAEAPLTLTEIEALQARKTGALLRWAAAAGARMAGADPAPLLAYGAALGRAFQIADDLLDVEGDAALVGKAVGKDEAAGKATFVSLLGVDGARKEAERLVENACDALSCHGEKAGPLRAAARFTIARRN